MPEPRDALLIPEKNAGIGRPLAWPSVQAWRALYARILGAQILIAHGLLAWEEF